MAGPSSPPDFGDLATSVLALESKLRGAFGWCSIQVIGLDRHDHTRPRAPSYVVRDGELRLAEETFDARVLIALPLLRLARLVDAALTDTVPATQRADILYVELPRQGWVSLRDNPRLYRGHRDGPRSRELVSEFDPGTHLEVVAEHRSQLLLRACCGTTGWCDASQATPAPTPTPWSAVSPDEFRQESLLAGAHELQRWLGTPYRLGGSSRHGIDCSALSQRVVAAMLGATIPRHSSDQLAIPACVSRPSGPAARSPSTFALTFLWTDREAHCHVTLEHPNWPGLSLHASRSMGRVVVVETAALESASRVVRRVTMDDLLRYRAQLSQLTSLPDTFLAGYAIEQ